MIHATSEKSSISRNQMDHNISYIYHNISLSIISDMHMRFPLIWWYPTVDTFSTEIIMATFHPHFRTPPLYIYIYIYMCVMLCCVMLCCGVLYHVMLCYIMLYIHTVICIHVHTYTYIIYTYMYVYKYIHIYISPSSSSSSPIGSMVLVH